MRFFILLIMLFLSMLLSAQRRHLLVLDASTFEPLPGATIFISGTGTSGIADGSGKIYIDEPGSSWIRVSASGYRTDSIAVPANGKVLLKRSGHSLDEVVVSGTLHTVRRSVSAIPVEVYSPKFFLKNPTPSLFDALQLVNGIRPQLNCNVCNTGDIHINGLEGPYTLILIDGMPIVSSLASVYGIAGIPMALVERIEVVKGPASSLYGSEAMGGLINVITKNPLKAPLLSVDISATSMKEFNGDLAVSYRPSSKFNGLAGINLFWFDNLIDANGDLFTDLTLQKRVSVFNKISVKGKSTRSAQFAMRYLYEDRWGGETRWNKGFRGSDSVYGESIYTSRLEITGSAPLIHREFDINYSLTSHVQRSVYGKVLFNAKQQTAFLQATWNHKAGEHRHWLSGVVGRYTFYDDNTIITHNAARGISKPDKIFIPGVFVQHEWDRTSTSQLLSGLRFDYDKRHGLIFTPRLAYKFSLNETQFRINAGSGFRVVNVFTEDHAALTGAREVVIDGNLRPERSLTLNLNIMRHIVMGNSWLNIDGSTWYTYFSNRILPDYTRDPNKIFYSNLDGHGISRGISISVEAAFVQSLRINTGFTFMDISNITTQAGSTIRQRPLLTENWSGTWTISYTIPSIQLAIDYSGTVYGPMMLPLVSALDPRPGMSKTFSIQNLQLSRKAGRFEWYGGVKNLLNWTPARSAPFLIARADDPFDKQVSFNTDGSVMPTANNPYALTFDPNYVYGPNQGRRLFAGLRYFIAQSKNKQQ